MLLAGNFSPLHAHQGGGKTYTLVVLMHLLLASAILSNESAMPLLSSFPMLFTPNTSALFLATFRNLKSLDNSKFL